MTSELLTGLDVFNAAFDLGLLIPFGVGLWTLYRAKDSRALSGLEQWPYMLHAAYIGLFFAAMNRWWSAAASVVWACAFVVKIQMIRRYRNPQGRAQIMARILKVDAQPESVG